MSNVNNLRLNKKVSVIIPVYNVEKYINRCIDSVRNQTYDDLEIILVDDGSPDSSPAICDEYKKADARIKVIHKANGGLSSARNAGLRVATGYYVAFVDSDDWIECDTYEYCVDFLEKNSADYIQYEVNITDSPEKKVDNPIERIEVYNNKEVLQYFMLRATQRSGGYSVCSGLYKRSLLEGLSFREGKINEDMDFKYLALSRCKRMVVTNLIKYNYFQANDSITTSGLKKKDFDLRESANLLGELSSKETYGTIAFLGQVKKARTAFSLLSKIAYFGIADPTINKKDIVKELTAEHRKNVVILLKSPIPTSRKLLALLFAVNFKLTEWCIHTAKHFTTYI